MSFIEKTAKKLFPILEDLKKKMVREKRRHPANKVSSFIVNSSKKSQ
jgi:hypothetical protein